MPKLIFHKNILTMILNKEATAGEMQKVITDQIMIITDLLISMIMSIVMIMKNKIQWTQKDVHSVTRKAVIKGADSIVIFITEILVVPDLTVSLSTK